MPNCELRRFFASHARTFAHSIFGRTHIARTCAFCQSSNRTRTSHVCCCACAIYQNSHPHTHVFSKKLILQQILLFFLHFITKRSLKFCHFYPKTCEIAIARRTPKKRPHARTSHAHFESLFARTSHTCVGARTCACANFISQLTDCQMLIKLFYNTNLRVHHCTLHYHDLKFDFVCKYKPKCVQIN